MIDYKVLIDGLRADKIMELFYKLGARDVINKPDCLITNTICHNADAENASMKLYYYKDSHLFMCYSEDGAMSIFSFLKHYYETRGIVYDWFKDILSIVLDCSINKGEEFNSFERPRPYTNLREQYVQRKNRRDLPSFPEGILEVFSTYHSPEWRQDGITDVTMDKFNIRFSVLENKIIIPHYDANGKLVGIRGRALDPWVVENVGKYMPVQIEQKWYSHPLSLNLYGLDKTKDNIKRFGICYLGEAEKFVLQADSFSFPNCAVGVCGSQFNKFQLDLLMRFCQPKEIVICFDKEELPGKEEYFNKLYTIGARYKNYANFSFIYDRQDLLKLKQSPTDCGEEVFRKLIERRIKI